MGQTVPEAHPRVEFNPHHPLVVKLAELREKDEKLGKMLAAQLIDTALLRAGLLEDPAQLADDSHRLLEKLLGE